MPFVLIVDSILVALASFGALCPLGVEYRLAGCAVVLRRATSDDVAADEWFPFGDPTDRGVAAVRALLS
jgi:hypothetical protein